MKQLQIRLQIFALHCLPLLPRIRRDYQLKHLNRCLEKSQSSPLEL